MKYIEEFRSGELARLLAEAIAGEVQEGQRYHLMEFCGGHTHAISRYGLADLLPKDRTTCVEISGLHCKMLESKGHRVVWSDFLPWADGRMAEGKRFDRIVMNPPFSEGRWRAHTEQAAAMLGDGGRLVAILPASAKASGILADFDCQWHGPYDNEFAGTSVSVVILQADKSA